MTTTQSVSDWAGLLWAIQQLKVNEGRRQPTSLYPDALRTINQLADQRLGHETFLAIVERWDDGARALTLCQSADLSAAGVAFAHARQRLDDLTGEARLLAEVMYSAKMAYYQYRTSQFDAAEASIARVLAIDDELQGTYHALHGHKLHILQNKSRTLAVRKRYDEAADLVLNIMHYIIAPRHKPAKTGMWSTALLRRRGDIQPLSSMFESIFFDLCRDCIRHPTLETAVIVRSGPFVKALRRVAATNDVYTAPLEWFLAKRALYMRHNTSAYVRQSTMFLHGYSSRYDIAKLLLLWDALRVAQLVDKPAEKEAISSFINEYFKLRLVD